jgi:hypothetical protein
MSFYVKASLGVHSQTLSIEELTQTMGAPDEVRVLGQSSRTPQGPPWPWNSWYLQEIAEVSPTENPIEAIEVIVDRLFIRLSLWDVEAALLKIRADVETVFGVYGSINARPGLCLSADQMKKIADLGASLDFEVYDMSESYVPGHGVTEGQDVE